MIRYIHKATKKQNTTPYGGPLAGLGVLCRTHKHGTYGGSFLMRIKRSLRNDYVTCPLCLDIIADNIYPSNVAVATDFSELRKWARTEVAKMFSNI